MPSIPSQTITEDSIYLSNGEASPSDENDVADFPLLAQAEHPSTSEGVWALHPCHTQQAVEEVIAASQKDGEDGGTEGGVEWLEAWLMVVGTVVDLRWRP